MILVWSITAIICIAYGIFALTLYFMQSKFLYLPTKDVVYSPAEINLTYEKVKVKTEDGVKITGWYIPAKNAERTIIFCHGQGGNIMHRLDTINIINGLGLNCLVFDYRGYGSSSGKPTEEGTYQDIRAVYKWLIETKDVKSKGVILFGRSLGCAIASKLATEIDLGGLVLESGFTSFADMGAMLYPYMPVRWFVRFGYKTIENMNDINCPVLIIHSRDDEIVPFKFALRLYEAAGQPKEFVEISGKHNDGFLKSGDVYKQGLKSWFDFVSKYKAQKGPILRKIS